MIRWPRGALPPVPRLMAALATRGHAAAPSALDLVPAWVEDDVRVVCLHDGSERDAEFRGRAGERVVVIGWVGTHPDSRHAGLRRLWSLEERARAGGGPVLVLRLAPLVGPASPLWLRLARRAPLGGLGRKLVQPVLESDVLETLARALDGQAAWEGWFEVCGPDVLSLAELAALAIAAGPAGAGAWEPPRGVLAEQGLAESVAWRRHFGIVPRSLEAVGGPVPAWGRG